MSINEPDLKPTNGIVKYQIRLSLGQYEHEELSVELSSSVESYSSPEDLMTRAIRIVQRNTTKARLKAAADKKAKEATKGETK